MRLHLASIVAALAATVATVAALPAAITAVPAAEHDAREACRFASFNGVTHRNEIRPRCRWYICGQNGDWHEVRDCGLESWCDAEPTVCKDRFGNLF